MKEVSKIKKIYEGFFGEEVPESVAKERRSKCAVCPFNSVNAEKLSLINNIRNTFTAPFCTLCSCQIHEKTGSPLEECAMYMIEEDKKWFKIKIETMGKEDLNLIQVGENTYDIQLSEGAFLIALGEVKAGEDTTMELVFETEGDNIIQVGGVKTSCGCTSSKHEPIDEKKFKVIFRIDINKVGMGSGAKSAEISYDLNGKPKKQKIKFKYFRTA